MQGLTGRLGRIADLIGHAHTLADIGSDHGLLPIALLKAGRIERAIAVELTEGPHQAVSRAMVQAAAHDRMEARMGDGFHPLLAEEADVVVIAGMGGNTIWSILTTCATTRAFGTRPPRLVLQPMNGAGLIRYFAVVAGFTVTADVRVKEGDVVYECLALDPLPLSTGSWVSPTATDRDAYDLLPVQTRMRYLCGELGLQMRCALLAEQLAGELAKRQLMMQSLAYPLAQRAQDRLVQVRLEYRALLQLQALLQPTPNATSNHCVTP